MFSKDEDYQIKSPAKSKQSTKNKHVKDKPKPNTPNMKHKNEKFESENKKISSLNNKTKSNLDFNSPKAILIKKKLKSNDDHLFNQKSSSSSNKELTQEEQLKNKKIIDKKLKFINRKLFILFCF